MISVIHKEEIATFVIYVLLSFYAADDVVLYKHGERSSDALKANGFSNVLFKSYNRFDTSPIQLRLAYVAVFYFSLITRVTISS